MCAGEAAPRQSAGKLKTDPLRFSKPRSSRFECLWFLPLARHKMRARSVIFQLIFAAALTAVRTCPRVGPHSHSVFRGPCRRLAARFPLPTSLIGSIRVSKVVGRGEERHASARSLKAIPCGATHTCVAQPAAATYACARRACARARKCAHLTRRFALPLLPRAGRSRAIHQGGRVDLQHTWREGTRIATRCRGASRSPLRVGHSHLLPRLLLARASFSPPTCPCAVSRPGV